MACYHLNRAAPWATELVERMPLQAGAHVLDVACGTGIVARLAAPRVRPGGAVTGLDLNPGMLTVARTLAQAPDVHMTWQEGSALALPFAHATFHVVLCQQGLQFFPDRLAALQAMRRVLVPGGQLGLSVWHAIPHNPYFAALGNALERHVSPEVAAGMRVVCALGEGETLQALLLQAGFCEVRLALRTLVMRFPSVETFIPGQFAATPFADAVTALDMATRTALLEDVRMALQPYTDIEGVAVPNTAHVAVARA